MLLITEVTSVQAVGLKVDVLKQVYLTCLRIGARNFRLVLVQTSVNPSNMTLDYLTGLQHREIDIYLSLQHCCNKTNVLAKRKVIYLMLVHNIT